MRASPLVLLASAAALLAARADATVVVVPTLEEMAAQSQVIAHVKVGAPRVELDAKGRVITLTPLQVVEGVKGAKAGDALEVFQVGGMKDGKGTWIAGAHRFQEGQELVFLGMKHQRGPGSVIPFGIGFGLFGVERDDFGVKVAEIVGDVVTLERGPDGRSRQGHPQVRSYDSLPGFLELLRRASAAEEAPKLMQVERRPARSPKAVAPKVGAPMTPAPAAPATPAAPAAPEGGSR